ncbi:putative RNA-directed DNA polymerase [Helianthus annuus]|nr:putative RNA-directed DNA polymerase [Helianthus annuus]
MLLSENRVAVCAILESHVDVTNLPKVCKAVFRNWAWTSNGDVCDRGTRIIIGWNMEVVDLMVLSLEDQVIHTQLCPKNGSASFFSSFVYAKNTYQERRCLWENLCMHKSFCHDKPWVVMGDFNSVLHVDDSLNGPSTSSIGMREFHDCVQHTELVDIMGHGLHYTWNQKPKKGIGLLKKIDRVMGNLKFIEMFPEAFVRYHPFRISDHTPCILNMSNSVTMRQKPFKFANFLTSKPDFRDFVEQVWSQRVEGFTMFSVTKKLLNLKPFMRKLLFNQGNLHEKVLELRKQLDDVQKQIDDSPLDVGLREKEANCLEQFKTASYDEECFLKQKSKVEWLCAGDSNTVFFHNMLKCRNARSTIQSIQDVAGNRFEGDSVPIALVQHYEKFLGQEDHVSSINMEELGINMLNTNEASAMVRHVSREEVKSAMFSIAENKAPGPDGYTSAFFKSAWDIVGSEVTNAVLDFFDNGKLLKQLNHTILALVPKVETPDSVLDYRPISCCNVLYKCISKIITDRLKGSLGKLVSINQSAFVPGRKISDNILLTQELMHNYHLNRGPARCAFKIDIQKAYDTVNWAFLESVLHGFGLHAKMVGWIMACVTSVTYSVSLQGNLHGYFRGKRGLRQGDPMSPYLFTMVMEILSLLLQRGACTSTGFKFHAQCVKQKIINVAFADDLFIFVHGDVTSVKKVRDALEQFTNASGLKPSPAKSTVYFCNVPQHVKQEILQVMPFNQGTLPVRYLGVPLISTKLMYKDCKPLVDRVEKKIDNWVNKSLSFAGRLQLITSVLSSMHVYWASVFIIPTRVTNELEKLMRRFLWNANNQGRAKAKVAWAEVCLPKDEGGLGIRSISDVNKALMANHVWSILTKRKSLWVQWIYSHKLNGKSLWDVQPRGSISWGWRKILAIRATIRPFIWKIIRNGAQTNAWSDKWNQICPLNSFISPRNIANAGFQLTSSIADIIDENGQWKWPSAWYDIYPVLIGLTVPQLIQDLEDSTTWKDLDGNNRPFGSLEVWHNIRTRKQPVTWVNGVWFSQCIPRHSFHLWLVIKNKLKTQDRLAVWEAGSETNLRLMCCPLCMRDRDSRDHLFFQCSFAQQVWITARSMVNMEGIDGSWHSIMGWLDQNASSKKTEYIVGKLVIAASTYFVWQERNNRLFSNTKANVEVISEKIVGTVRLRLMGFKFKSVAGNQRLLKKWNIVPSEAEIDPG